MQRKGNIDSKRSQSVYSRNDYIVKEQDQAINNLSNKSSVHILNTTNSEHTEKAERRGNN